MIQVMAAIIRKDDRILICQRDAGSGCPFLWEFPGGKLEPGETPEQCITRECKEELDIDIKIQGVFARTTYQYPGREIAFTFFNAEIADGEIKKGVHKDLKWVLPAELGDYEFCPADREIVEKLK